MIKKLLLILLLTITIFFGILRPGYFPTHDDFSAIRLLEMDKCVKDGQIPCRWVPDMGFGYGYPQFNYYAPAPYYAMEMFHLIGANYLDSIKIFLVLITIISAIGMFIFANYLWGGVGGIISTILYIYLPYRAVDFYARGDLPELTSLAILPFLFLFAKRIADGKKNSILFFAISVMLLFTTHSITSVITTPFLFLWCLVQGKKYVKLFIGFVWGIAMASFFVIPAWSEKGLVHIDTITSGYFNYLAHFVDIRQLFISTHWGYGVSMLGPNDDTSFAIGILQWVLPIIAIALIFILRKKEKKLLIYSISFTVMGFIALFMTHQKSVILWNNISILKFVQFPWRFLLPAGFLLSVAAGSFGIFFKKKIVIVIVLLSIFGISIGLYGRFFMPKEWVNITDSQKFSGDAWIKQITASIYDYLPNSVKKAPDKEASDKPISIIGNINIISGTKRTDSQNWKVNVLSNNATLQLQLYYFPDWNIKVDGTSAKIDYNNEFGLMEVPLTKGEHDISAKLIDTTIRRISNYVSLISVIPIIYLVSKKWQRKY
ncbi:6-pyruvoyl-tetrahydropterin synthase-related protein [soil metagenome]